jgi:hypothetical protein
MALLLWYFVEMFTTIKCIASYIIQFKGQDYT